MTTEILYIELEDQTLTILEDTTTTLIEVASQGPEGPQGPVGPAGSATIEAVVSTNISGHKGVRFNSSGQLKLCSSVVLGDTDTLVGITIAAATTGNTVSVQNNNILEHLGWSFTADQPVYLGDNGDITQTLPPSAVYIQIVGTAVSPTKLSINIQQAIRLA